MVGDDDDDEVTTDGETMVVAVTTVVDDGGGGGAVRMRARACPLPARCWASATEVRQTMSHIEHASDVDDERVGDEDDDIVRARSDGCGVCAQRRGVRHERRACGADVSQCDRSTKMRR